MAHFLFRLFQESKPDDARVDRVRREMMSKVRAIPGFQRWAGLQTEDGRYGGFQVYDTQRGVEQAVQLFDDWRRSAGMNNPVQMEVRGETGFSIATRSDYETAYGVVRIYKTESSFKNVNDAIEQAADEIRAVPGLLRYTTARFDDGRIATFASYETEQGAQQMTAKARELRNKAGSQLSKVLPHDPEVITGKITLAFTKEPAHAPA